MRFSKATYKVFVTALVFTIVAGWIFSAWSQIRFYSEDVSFEFPPNIEIAMAATSALPTLRPVTPDGTVTGYVNEADGTTNLYVSVDDDPDSPVTTDWVDNNGVAGSVFFNLTDMPSDFGSMATLQIDFYLNAPENWVDDIVTLYGQVFQSDEITTLTSEEQLATHASGAGYYSVTFTTVTGSDKATWDGARLKLNLVYTATKNSESVKINIAAVELDGVYNIFANSPPTVSNVVLDGGTAITLTENTTKSVSATADVSDPNGPDDIVSATSTIYRSGVGAGCPADDENCYKIASCTFFGATSTVTCTANIQFFADPTDASSTAYSAQDWQAHITVTDSASATGASSTASGVDLNTLWAIDVTGAINYGSVSPDSNTGETTQTVTVTNTGNAAIDVDLYGTDMTLGGSTIAVEKQKYATSTFTYNTCTVCTFLSSTPTAYELDLAKPISTTPVTDTVYWGLAVPSGTAQGAHSGTNTFTAVGD